MGEVEVGGEQGGVVPEGPRADSSVPAGGLRAPFPWFGGKRRVAALVWAALGDPALFVEPFAGSLAVLLVRPPEHLAGPHLRFEVVCDRDRFLVNFWRAVRAAPDEVLEWADRPVTEVDLTAIHGWLATEGGEVLRSMRHDPGAFDAKIAGWWVWGLGAWVGSCWCSPEPWAVRSGRRPHVGTQGVHTRSAGGVPWPEYFRLLSERLRHVLVFDGDWSRTLTRGVLTRGFDRESLGIFLDPPYLPEVRERGLYSLDGSSKLTAAVRERALEIGELPWARVCVAGYDVEHGLAFVRAGWREVAWVSNGQSSARASKEGDTLGEQNWSRERLWFSPGCLLLGSVEETT